MLGLKHKNSCCKTTFTATLLILGLILGSCKEKEITNVSASTPTPSASLSPVNSPSSKPSPQPELLQEALNAGTYAADFAQVALDKVDWQIVAERWQKAIQLLEAIPESNKNYDLAQQKIVEYKKNADIAKTKAQQVEQENFQEVTIAAAPSPTVQSSVQPQSSQVISQPQTAPVDMARKLLNDYIYVITKSGNSGTGYWCSQYAILQSSLFAPRKVEILNYSQYGDSASAKLRIESSNRGGSPIIADWSLYMVKEEDSERAKQLPGGWCIANLREG